MRIGLILFFVERQDEDHAHRIFLSDSLFGSLSWVLSVLPLLSYPVE